MKSFWLGITGAVLVATAATYPSAGGWAVVKVQNVPDAAIAGKPVELSWDVRQHGVTLLDGLRPTIEARSGSRVVIGKAWEVEKDGAPSYRGQIAFPASGDWQVTINSGFGRSRAVLVPLRAVDADAAQRTPVAAVPEAERGRRSFAALGCVTCHTQREVGITGEASGFGPDLSERRLAADYLTRFLADPSIKPATNGKRMPNLALREAEIKPLVAFLAADRRVSTR